MAPRGKSSPWILSSWRDLLLYIATPLLILPVFAAAQRRWSAQEIFLFVSAFGATGHHLPGMIRAYGDRALFERFKWRFIVAPIFLVAVCAGGAVWDLKGLELLVFSWGLWHGMMQTYGFCRIYDAKSGAFDALNRRLDFALCLGWFAAGVVLSPLRSRMALDLFYNSGGPLISQTALDGFRTAVWWGLWAVTVVFLAHFVWAWRRGRRANPVKLALLGVSFAFWWYCNHGVANVILGVALFEVFHDVQYLSIVWLYNRNRVERDDTVRGFMRFVFRRSGTLLGAYVGLVLAYGALALAARGVPMDGVKRVLMGVVTASALLHFYYDGFIWKVREKSTRQTLGLEGGADGASGRRAWLPPWAWHGLKWAAFVLPFAVLTWLQTRPATVTVLKRQQALAAFAVDDPVAHLKLAVAAHEAGRLNEALREYAASLALRPDAADTRFNYATALADDFQLDAAAGQYREAIRLQPDHPQAECNLANILAQLGQFNEARSHYERSLQIRPNQELVHKNLADLLIQCGRNAEAADHYREALRLRPDYRDARAGLASLSSPLGH